MLCCTNVNIIVLFMILYHFVRNIETFYSKLPVSVTDNGPVDMAMDHGSHTAD